LIINLFYPVSYLPHKNHEFLKNSKIINFLEQNNIKILLTIEKKDFELDSKNIKILGRISHNRCIEIMNNCSGLLFLSSFESLGLPILEACTCKKSIIITDLEYARELLGNSAYFLKYPLDVYDFLSVLNKFKNDFIKNNNYPAELTTRMISSKELLNIFFNKLEIT